MKFRRWLSALLMLCMMGTFAPSAVMEGLEIVYDESFQKNFSSEETAIEDVHGKDEDEIESTDIEEPVEEVSFELDAIEEDSYNENEEYDSEYIEEDPIIVENGLYANDYSLGQGGGIHTPLEGRHLSLPYGGFIPLRNISASANTSAHLAQDYYSDSSEIMAIYNGEVFKVKDDYSQPCGKYIVIKHIINGITVYSEYQHLFEIENKFKTIGTPVTAGEKIAVKGGSGYGVPFHKSYGENGHLHIIIISGDSITHENISSKLWTPQFASYVDEYGTTIYYDENKEIGYKKINNDKIYESNSRNYFKINGITYYNPEKILNVSYLPGDELVKVESIVLNENKKVLDLTKHEVLQLEASINPGNAAYKAIIWSSTNDSIATVDSSGLVTPVAPGEADIICTAQDGSGVYATCHVKVYNFTLNKAEIPRAYIGYTETLVGMEGDKAVSCSFSSSDKSIVSVTSKGKITAKKAGEAIITAKTSKASATCKVTVLPKPTSVTFDGGNTITVNVGEKTKPTLKVLPENAYFESIAWYADKKAKAFINLNEKTGEIEGIKAGTALVSVKIDRISTKQMLLTVVVKDPYAPDSVSTMINGQTKRKDDTVDLAIGQTLTVTPVLSPKTAKTVYTWQSSKINYATIDANGVVKGVKAGTSTITVTTSNGKNASFKVKVYDPSIPSGITITYGNTFDGKTLDISEEAHFYGHMIPETASNDVTWSAKPKNIVKIINDAGPAKPPMTNSVTVVPLKEGTVTLTAQSKKQSKVTASIRFKVEDKYKPTSVKLPYEGMTYTGSTYAQIPLDTRIKLTPELTPSDARTRYTWSSSNSKIVEVNDQGEIYAKKVGKAKITLKTTSPKTTLNIEVYNPKKVQSIVIDEKEFDAKKKEKTCELKPGESLQLHATLLPSTASAPITWSSSSAKKVFVDENGLVTAIKPDSSATITAKADGKKQTIKIKVKKATKPTSIYFDEDSTIQLCYKSKYQLEPLFLPEGAYGDVTWKAKGSVKVSSTGLVTAKSLGEGTVTAKTGKINPITLYFDVVNEDTLINKVKFTSKSTDIKVGETRALQYKTSPSGGLGKLTWSSSNTTVAQVEDGVVTGIAEGEATIYASTLAGKKYSTKVNVNDPSTPESLITSISLIPESLTLSVGNTYSLSATVSPSNATNRKVTWASSNASVVTIKDAVITAVGPGTAIISATAVDGSGVQGICEVTVNSIEETEMGAAYPTKLDANGEMILDIINKYRINAGLNAYTVDEELCAFAYRTLKEDGNYAEQYSKGFSDLLISRLNTNSLITVKGWVESRIAKPYPVCDKYYERIGIAVELENDLYCDETFGTLCFDGPFRICVYVGGLYSRFIADWSP